MEDSGSLWTYNENMEELKHKLLCTTFELESVKIEAKEQMTKSDEYVKNLLDLLKVAYKERDEAREQLHKLLNKIMLPNQTDLPNMIPHFYAQPESPMLVAARANSSITESNSLSAETYNHGSSPVDSLFDAAVSSPEFSNMNVVDSSNMGLVKQQLVQDYNHNAATSSVPAPKIDPASVVIENLAKGKALPQKGKLLQAVMEAGPLLQTLLLAGPLPRWRNPPPLQTFKIPPVSIKGVENAGFHQKSLESSCFLARKSLNVNSLTYQEMTPRLYSTSSQTCSASMLNFAGGSSSTGSFFSNNRRLLTTSSSFNDQIPIGKRQRLH